MTSSPAGIDCGSTCSASFPPGTGITLTAAPTRARPSPAGPAEDCSGTGTCTLTLNSNTSVTAASSRPRSPLLVNKSGTGTGGVTSSPDWDRLWIDVFRVVPARNAPCTLTAAAAAGSTFTGWSGGGCSGTGTCTVTLNVSTTVTAGFSLPVPNPTLTVTKSGTGTGGVTSSPPGINCGATCSASFPTRDERHAHRRAPTPASTFAGWSGGGCSGTGTCTLTLNANTTVTAAFSVTGSGPTYPQAVAADSPISYWRLNELSGTTAADSAGASPGTYSGATLGGAGLAGEHVEQGRARLPASGKVTVASTAALSPPTKVSVEAWIKPSALPAAARSRRWRRRPSRTRCSSTDRSSEFTIMQAGTRRRLQAPAGAVAVGGVYHVVGTYDGTTQRLYINGAQVASAALTGAITTNANPFYIASWNGSSEFFRGTIDEVAVYPTALSADAGVEPLLGRHHVARRARAEAPASTQLVAVSELAASRHAAVGGSTPVAVAFDAGLHRAYVTGNAGRGHAAGTGVTIFDTRTWRALGTVNTSPTAGASASRSTR